MAERKLPPALARRAAATAKHATAKHRHEAEELVRFVLEKKREIAGAFWDAGNALGKLRDPRLYGALGCASFEEVVTTRLGFSFSTARKLVAIADHFPRSLALRLGQERAAAIVGLAEAMGEDAAKLANENVRLPGHHAPIRPASLGANELKRLASEERRLRAPRDGSTVTKKAAEAAAAKLAARIRRKKIEAVVEVVRAKGGLKVRVTLAPDAAVALARLA